MAYTGRMASSRYSSMPLLRPLTRCLSHCMAAVAACLFLAGHAWGTTVYKTVDENGVVSFSDSAPADGEPAEALDIDVVEPQLDQTEQQRLEEMRKTTDRMVEDRLAREKHRAEMRKLQAQERAPSVDYPQPEPRYDYYYPTSVISTHSRRRDGRFGVYYRDDNFGAYYGSPARPHHPIARPPLRPGHGKPHRPEPRQAPVYNDYPASMVRKGYDPRVREVIETGHYPARR